MTEKDAKEIARLRAEIETLKQDVQAWRKLAREHIMHIANQEERIRHYMIKHPYTEDMGR